MGVEVGKVEDQELTARLRLDVAALVGALGIAAAWPVSAYELSPFLIPALLAAAGSATLVLLRPEYGIAVVAALAPLTNLQLGGSQGMKPVQFLLPALAGGVVVYAALVGRERSGARAASGLSIAIFLFLGAAVASSVQALDPAETVKKLIVLLTAAGVFYATLEICRGQRERLVVVGGVLAGLLIAAGQGVLQQYLGQVGEYGIVADGSVVGRIQGSFGHPNQYGGFVAVLVPLATAVALTRGFAAPQRWLAGMALLLALPAITFTYARGAIVALVFGSLLWLAILRPRHALLVAVVVGLAATALAPAALKERFDPDEGTSGDITLRADIWSAALDIYSREPLLGVGLNNFGEAYRTLPTTLDSTSQRRLLHQSQVLVPPHAQNLYLNVLAEEGIIGFAAFACFAFAAVAACFRGVREADPLGRAVALGAGAGLFTLAVHSLLEVTLIGEVALPLFALLAVVASSAGSDREATRSPSRA